MTLSALERRGLVAIIDDAIELLRPNFDGVVGNGVTCPACHAHGYGIPEDHKSDCRGVITLGELRAAQIVLKRPSTAEPEDFDAE